VPRLHIKHSSSADVGDVNTRYIGSYLGTLRRALSHVTWTWCWVTADVCDYQHFDFTWHPSEWQDHMLSVFASGSQKFGDTFYVHVPTFLEKSQNLALLEWFDTLNFIQDPCVPRHAVPRIKYHSDSVVPAVLAHDFSQPIAEFYCQQPATKLVDLNLWRDETKAVTLLRTGGTSVLVPREAKNHLRTQMYDYPVIDRGQDLEPSEALDIVYISNGEPDADRNWASLMLRKQGQPNRLVRVDRVPGRAAAYHAAARASETPWFFAVFAKLDVLADFDWSWQPDRLQQPKHYIFHALNPVNMLEYGHQAMIAYNRDLVLANPGRGLDFTLDDAHEVVPILSGVARYNTDAWTAWRTAFREVIKLQASLPDVENEYRLRQWLTKGQGPYGEWSVYGAEDGVAYYQEVAGDFDELRKSYEWSWLASYLFFKRGISPTR
jgi:hypothetical protein